MLGFIHTDSNKKVMKRKKILAIYIYISKFSYKLKKNMRIIHFCTTRFPFKSIHYSHANVRLACQVWWEMPHCSITTKYVNFNTHKDKKSTFNSYRNFCISWKESNLVQCQKSHSFVTFTFPFIQTCSNATSTCIKNYLHTNSMY